VPLLPLLEEAKVCQVECVLFAIGANPLNCDLLRGLYGILVRHFPGVYGYIDLNLITDFHDVLHQILYF